MNRIDRLFAITLLLQAKGRVRARDLATWFEVSERTIYRDMGALSESGVPVISLPGEGYELMEGFYLPPLLFTPAEASALFLGAQMLASHATGRLPASAQQALDKVAAILPQDLRVDGLDLLRKTFKPRPSEQAPSKLIEVRIRFAPEVVRWVRERQHYAFQAEEPAPDGGAVMVYRLGTLQEIKSWLLSWGAAAEPLAPAHLREEIRQEILKLVDKLT